jgi:8-oxo-dGTP pyrophosphatase MutT (NUDIX family)
MAGVLMTFLDIVIGEYNQMRARFFSGDGYEGVTHAGIALVAADTGRVFLTKRADDPTDAPEVRETWEFPGGGLREGEEPYTGAVREVIEETGWGLPDDSMVENGWRSEDGVYQGFVVTTTVEFSLEGWTPTTEVSDVGWFDRDAVNALAETGALRPEVKDQTDWGLIFGSVSGNEEDGMAKDALAASAAVDTEDTTDYSAVFAEPIPIHGVLAPEEVPTGDKRGFAAGSMTARAGRLPFRWQETDTGQHNGARVVGSVDRMMRKDGLIHWQGLMMPSEKSDEFAGVMEFFGGRYGVSVDGDNGTVNGDRTEASGVLWFDAVRASGLTAVDIPAFSEAYVAFGPHPDMPEDGSEEFAVLTSSGDMVSFKRGPGWVTNPADTKRIHDYWMPGHPGGDKIAWGTPGDFRRAKALIGEKILKNSPEKARFLNQIIAQWHHDALGYWPGDLGKPGNAPDTPENRRRAARHAAASVGIEVDAEGEGWEAVLTSSAGARALPPLDYFDRHPDTDATVIEEPDEFGIRRTYGYAAEHGVCHIGKRGCVTVPIDATGEYAEFHLGRTKTDDGYVNTGVITYKVDHRDAQTILSETAEQQHFDNIAHAWAAVRLGNDERGIWFSGVVLPGISDEDCVLIEATGQVSGEWKYGALRALQAVNVPGFPVMRSSAAYDDEGNMVALVASAVGEGSGECEPTPAERMAALAKIDAEVRFEALREKFNWTDVAESLVSEATDEGRVAPVGLRDDGAVVYELDGETPGTDTIVAPMPGES